MEFGMRYVRTFDGTFNEAKKYSYDGIFKIVEYL